MLFSLSFNGIKKDYLICERGKRRSAFAPIKRNLLTVLGMPGAHLESTDTEVRVIQQPITINAKDRLDQRKLEEDLSDWLVTDQPVELIFDDEPDRVYYAVVDGSLDIEDIARFGKGTITFICPDPYKYGEEQTISWPESATIQTDFTGKVAGSTVENPHVAKRTWGGASGANSLLSPSSFPTDFNQSDFNGLKVFDGTNAVLFNTGYNNIPQQLSSFNLISLIERKYGTPIPGATTAEKVAWLKANITQLTANWHGKGTNKLSNPIGTANFSGKVSGSTVENPHLAKISGANSLQAPSNFTSEDSQAAYDLEKTLNGVTRNVIYASSGNIAQHLFSFNLIEYVQRKYGVTVPGATTADKVQWLRDNVGRISCSWHGFGSAPSGNTAYFTFAEGSTWFGSPYRQTSDSVIVLRWNINSPGINNRIQADGFIHFLAYAEASNGTTASTINTDYVELEVELKAGQDKASFTIWDTPSNAWSSSVVTKTNSSVSLFGYMTTNTARIDSNGFIHFLAYAEPSNGIAPSVIETDYIELLVTTKLPHLPIILNNKGTAETYPVIKAIPKEPITFLDMVKDNAYMRIGEPIYEGMVPTKAYDRILVDSFASMVGWGALTAGSVLPDGIVGGNMKTTGGSFEADSFGNNPNGWVGPAVKKSFSEPLQDFAIDLEVTSRNTQGFTGKLQAAFLDASNNVVMSMALMDGAVGVQENRAIFKLGERSILNEKGSNHGSYNNETVHLNFTRKGQEITAYVYKQTGDVRDGRIRQIYKDLLNEYQTPITQIVVYMAKYKEYSTFPMSFNHLIVDKLYSLSEMQIPYIANPGDIIEIDHFKSRILINGEDKKDLKDFGASFFPLDKGDNVLVLSPFASLEKVDIDWRSRYK